MPKRSPMGAAADPVAVTGVGVILPGAATPDEYWQVLVTGVSQAAPLTGLDTAGLPVRFGCEVRADPTEVLSNRELRRMDRFSHLAVYAAVQAVADAGLGGPADPDRCGVFFGVGLNGMDTLDREFRRFVAGQGVHPLFLPLAMPSSPAANVALRLGWRGPATATNTACSSSAYAIGEAARLVASGDLDLALAGGTETPLSPMILAAFAGIGALSTANDAPDRACRPFDLTRDGFVMGEGAACCVLEPLSSARRRGVEPYAVLLGYARNGDAYHLVAPRPDGAEARWCMADALRDACLKPTDIGHINAHGTATQANDTAEARAIVAAFGPSAPPVTATKATIGHLIGGSAAAEAVACCLALRHGLVPPTANYATPDPECPLDVVADKPRPLPPGAVLSNSFAFGGHNAALVFAGPEHHSPRSEG